VAVNLAERQLRRRDFPAEVARVLAETGAEASSLCLEITEGALIADPETAVTILRDMKALGVHIAIDDFGTGYSSLAYLKRFPVDTLKVDRSFVSGLGRQSEDSAIVTAIIHLARALGLHAVAEGVETEGQLARLRSLGCDYAQGFHFARPITVPEIEQMLLRQPLKL
jgi:EAL domain-containing protein (putative c-di-GMP-specific phosphodiesterase class I)